MKTPSERRRRILDLIRQEQYATVNQLSEVFRVSGSTIRNDLRELESEGLVDRVHGGARWAEAEDLYADYAARVKLRIVEKGQIAEVAAELVRDRSVISLDGSTTAFHLARCLAGRNITVVTNGVYSALELARHSPTRIILIGGELYLKTGCTVGHMGRAMLGSTRSGSEELAKAREGLRMQQFFTSPGGLTVTDGLMDIDPDENLIKERMIALAEEVIVLADYTKIGRTALLPYAPIWAISCLITDEKADSKYVKQLEEAGVSVVIAPGRQSVSS